MHKVGSLWKRALPEVIMQIQIREKWQISSMSHESNFFHKSFRNELDAIFGVEILKLFSGSFPSHIEDKMFRQKTLPLLSLRKSLMLILASLKNICSERTSRLH